MVVIFRVDPTGEVYALLPFEPSDVPGFITCFEADGRRCPADFDYCVGMSRPANRKEFTPLLKTMRAAGLSDLVLRRRRPKTDLSAQQWEVAR
jgi:hypothetical protein